MRFPRLATVWLMMLSACAQDERKTYNGETNVCEGMSNALLCSASGVATQCVDGTVSTTEQCTASGKICLDNQGCRTCRPFSVSCENNQIHTCSADGMTKTDGTQCNADGGEYCTSEGCKNLCAEAEAAHAYIGCEYWPVTLPNSNLVDTFPFVVVLANPQLVRADVSIFAGDTLHLSISVDPGAVRTVELPWVTANFLAGQGGGPSVLVEKSAYRIVSRVPVVAYQFNSFEFESGGEYSFTNDASLLLPAHALTQQYMAVSRPTLRVWQTRQGGGEQQFVSPGFVSVTATHEGATTVHLRFTSYVRSVGPGHGPYAPGDEDDFDLQRGDVLTLLSATPAEEQCVSIFTETDGTARYCDAGNDYDLTGTEITASQPVAAFSGHDCAFVPFNRWACDHLEEQLFPIESWDREALASMSQKLSNEPNYVRVMSATDGNQITFTPAVVPSVTLNRGEFVEIASDNDVLVRGSAPVLVAQFLVGQDFRGRMSSTTGVGDPSMGLVPPRGQLRSDYSFLVPDTYTDNYANITVEAGATVTIDDVPITVWQTSATPQYVSARIRVQGGRVHRVLGSVPFALQVYGYARYTSYLYAGGLDLKSISPPIL